MIEVYSTNIEVAANADVPFNNVVIRKGCTAVESAPATIQLNKCGVYEVSVDASALAATTIQLKRDGVLLPQAQSTGESLHFTTLIQVPTSNTTCCCTSPTTIQLETTGTAAATFINVNVCVNKLC